jgi:GNAT superfamily N-acetyltransferase
VVPVPDRLGPDALDAIAALCRRAAADPPSRAELDDALTATEQPAVVRGDPAVGVVATVTTGAQGFVRLLVVDPDHRGRGVGRALLAAAEDDLRAAGATAVTVGADPPGYLWPGVDVRETALLCLLERAKYARGEASCNMDVDLRRIPSDPGGWTVAGPADRAEVDEWSARHWDHWRAELVKAADRATLVLTRDAEGIAGVCAYDVTRRGLVGPVAVRPDLLGGGHGVAPLLGALHTLRDEGRDAVEISWVGPLVPYARVGATVGRLFFVYRKQLR